MSLLTNPTATIAIDGLAICYFDKSKLRWVVRFPKEPTHKLKLRIDGTAYPVADAESLNIFTIKGIYPDYGGKYKGGCLDKDIKRKSDNPDETPGAPNSMRWAINLCDKDDVPPRGYRGLQRPPYGNIELKVNNAVFYVGEVPKTLLYRIKLGLNGKDPNVRKGKEFGRVSGLIAGDILCEEKGGVVIMKDKDVLVTLEAKPGVTHNIQLSNIEPPKFEEMELRSKGEYVPSGGPQPKDEYYKGDFDVYYDSLKGAVERYALWGLGVYERGSRTDCDAVWMDDPELP